MTRNIDSVLPLHTVLPRRGDCRRRGNPLVRRRVDRRRQRSAECATSETLTELAAETEGAPACAIAALSVYSP